MNIVSQGASKYIMSQNYYWKMKKRNKSRKQNTTQKRNQSDGLVKSVLSRVENTVLKLTDF